MKEPHYHLFFGMFANELKVGILSALMQKPMGATELASQLRVERSRVSHALLTMNRCHVVEAAKNGKYRIYSLNKDTVRPLMELADRHVSRYCKYCWAKGEDELNRRG